VADADVIVACTTRYVLRADAFVPGRRLIVIDLGLPRSVDPAVGTVAGVEFLDLETIKLHAPLETMNAHDDARALIKDAAAGFIADSAAGPAIAALRRQVFETLDAEIVRARSRGAGDETEAALRHFAGVLLHGPSVRIRDLAGEGRIDELSAALQLVHGIQVTSPSEPAGRAETG
jgi:glutamyl-tRNA reductase